MFETDGRRSKLSSAETKSQKRQWVRVWKEGVGRGGAFLFRPNTLQKKKSMQNKLLTRNQQAAVNIVEK